MIICILTKVIHVLLELWRKWGAKVGCVLEGALLAMVGSCCSSRHDDGGGGVASGV